MAGVPVLMSWSGGKDSAFALARLRAGTQYSVVGLLTTVTSQYDRVSIHGVRRSLLHWQADALGLELREIVLEPLSSNEAYEAAWKTCLAQLPASMSSARTIAYGDIYLEDVRSYREQLAGSIGFESIFPLWGERPLDLAHDMIDAGIEARLVCVDTEVLPAEYAGRIYDRELLGDIPPEIDPCGERGEFHTFVSNAPGFASAIPYHTGDVVLRDARFAYCDLLPQSRRVGEPASVEQM
jgi:uncharacterized protein (TIGR00290 family)